MSPCFCIFCTLCIEKLIVIIIIILFFDLFLIIGRLFLQSGLQYAPCRPRHAVTLVEIPLVAVDIKKQVVLYGNGIVK